MTDNNFFVLKRRYKKQTRSLYLDILDESDRIGKHQLHEVRGSEPKRSGNFMYTNNKRAAYGVHYNAKSWQHKAWKNISREIDWERISVYSGRKRMTKKMRHLLFIGVSMKVKAEDKLPDAEPIGKAVLDQMVPNKDHGGYMIAQSDAAMKRLFNRMYEMMYTKAKDYIRTLDVIHYTVANYVFKAIVVYDDKSYDTFTGNPLDMFKELGIEFDKSGKVYL